MSTTTASTAQQSVPPILRQGDLDGLCGVYSVINAMTLMLDDDFDRRHAFSAIVRSLGSSAANITIKGSTVRQFAGIMRACSTHLFRCGVEMHFTRASVFPEIGLGEFWAAISGHCDEHGPGSVILGLSGEHDHWTCLEDITPKAMILADSGAMARLERSMVTTKAATAARPHVLYPTHSYLLTVRSRVR